MIEGADQLERARRYLGSIPGAAERATARALNAAIRTARDEAIERIVARYEVKAEDVAVRMTITAARPTSLAALLTAKSGALPLVTFPHTPSAPGTGGPGRPALVATVLRGASKPVRGGFVARLGSKDRIAKRTGGKTRTGKDALAVLFTVPIAEMLGVPSVRLAVEERALEVLDEKMSAEIDRELAEAARP